MSKTADFVNLCISASEGTTNRIRLKIDRFLAAQIPLPPLDEQCRVVARIEELAAKVAETRGLRKEAEKEIGFISRSASLQIFEAIKDNQNVMVENICAEIIDNLHSNPIYSDIGVPCVRSPDVGWGKLYLEKALKPVKKIIYIALFVASRLKMI